MKVYALPQADKYALSDYGINRNSRNLIKYAPPEIEIVDNEDDADLSIFYAHGFRRSLRWRAMKHLENGKKYAVVQLCLRTTPNPKTDDWMELWTDAKLVWSYYNLPKLCEEDGNQAEFNFYHAPLGVDSENFRESKVEKKYLIAVHSKDWLKESLKDIWQASQELGGTVLNFSNDVDKVGEGIVHVGDINTGNAATDDQILASYYSQCKYVSGLRRVEGFEMPVLEGLMCGARPICFDLDCYRQWFDGFAEFIPDEDDHAKITASVARVLSREPKPVSSEEKLIIKEKFNWQKIASGFWQRILEND